MTTKDQYTRAFIANGNDSVEPDTAHYFFWHNIIENGGLRLTSQGYDYLLNVLNLEYYEIKLADVGLTNRFLLGLDRYINCPYYIFNHRRGKKIVLFDKKVFFALTMYNNDFEKFINAHKL